MQPVENKLPAPPSLASKARRPRIKEAGTAILQGGEMPSVNVFALTPGANFRVLDQSSIWLPFPSSTARITGTDTRQLYPVASAAQFNAETRAYLVVKITHFKT